MGVVTCGARKNRQLVGVVTWGARKNRQLVGVVKCGDVVLFCFFKLLSISKRC